MSDRVEQALQRSKGSLRLWLVFETAGEAESAQALLTRRKVRHVEALSRQEWLRREERAYARIAREAAPATALPANDEPMPEPKAETVPKPSRARRGSGA